MNAKNLGIGEMIKLGLVLVCYAVASCAVLAVVNNFTLPKIKQNQIDKANAAMKQVFPQADSFEAVSDFEKSSLSVITLSDFYLVKENGEVTGAILQASGPTYDKGKIIVGMRKDGSIEGIRILELSDSPGFGLKANDPSFKLASGLTFYDQFSGKSAKNGFTVNENFDCISGATITSKGIGDLVTQASKSMLTYFKENGNE
ncbi:MAG: FMN-binding protein [Treponema sp.]|nr:FMN-binding protein [Treponema sp.]